MGREAMFGFVISFIAFVPRGTSLLDIWPSWYARTNAHGDIALLPALLAGSASWSGNWAPKQVPPKN